jgi:MtrB/PioB family decaheme-associated outer membrane protein
MAMGKGTSLILIAATAICVWPLYAAAQTSDGGFMLEEGPKKEKAPITTSSIEVGVGWNSADSFKAGEYTGLNDRAPFAVGNVNVIRRAPRDGDSTMYWELTGTNLGLSSRSVRGEFGYQGTFSVYGEYDQIPHYRLDSAQTPFRGAGSTSLTLPPGWVPAGDAPDFTTLDASLRSVDIKTERKKYGGGFSWNFAKDLALSGSYHREDKDGLETIAGIFGTNGGNPRSTILPKPIDYTTHDADVTLSYNRPMLQAQLNYHLSIFNDNQSWLTWANPYNAVGGFAPWDPSQDFNNGGQGRMALEPDNSAHQISLSGAYMITPTTRVAGNFSYGRMFQNDDFLPYTINSSLSAPASLPRDSLDGDVTTWHANMTLSARPMPKADAKLEYTFDFRDNNTPQDIYLEVPNDTADQGAIDSSSARINRPYSRRSHKVQADAGYRILPSTKVGVGYDFETVNRDFTEVEDTYEHTGRVKVRSAPVSFASGWVEYAFSKRTGSDYVSNNPFLASHTDQHIATFTVPSDFYENNPYLRKFYIADRDRHLVKGALTVIPTDQVTVGVSGAYSNSDYPNSTLGLTHMTYGSVTGDATFMPMDSVVLSGFVTYERGKYDVTNYQRGSTGIAPTDMLDPTLFWTETSTDRGITAGAEVEWTAIKDRLTFSADYVFSRTTTEFEFEPGSGVTASPVPDLTSTLHSLGLKGEYKIQDNLSVKLGYRIERYDSNDFALTGMEAIPLVVTLGNVPPHYTSHVVWSSIVYHF